MILQNWIFRFAMAACAASAAWAPTCRAAAAYDQLYVFGDSLSDVGNNGRYSAGYLWDEHVAGAFGQVLQPSNNGGTDYAISGALITGTGSTSLPAQVAAYLAAHPKADHNAVYMIWGGGNDAFSTLGNPASGAAVEAAGIADTMAMISALRDAGARHIVVGNVPRTDLTPYVQSQGAAAVAQQAALVQDWNRKLARQIQTLNPKFGQIWIYDSAAGMQAVWTSPTHFNFNNLTTPCGSSCADPDHTFFWDAIHPGATAHGLIGSAIGSLIAQ
jgi:phospholipase/lecithinase/hemolysin